MEQEKSSTISIVAFILSFFTTIIGFILSIVALSKIKKNEASGKGFAVAGMVISSVKMVGLVAVIILIAVGGIFTGSVLPSIRNNLENQVKCQSAFGCEDNGDGTATCKYYNDDGDIEYGVICPSANN